MSERDRLAALLHDPVEVCWNNEFGCGGPADHLEQADRLIAAGVMFRDTLVTLDAPPMAALAEMDADIDVERLARALPGHIAAESEMEYRRSLSAAIAAAYREDAG